MEKKLRIFLVILTMIFPAVVMIAGEEVYTPKMMPNVQVADRSAYISDPAHLLSASTTASVNAKLGELRQRTTCEVVVAIPPSIGDEEAADWCESLFTLWGIGKKDKDNGLLLMISPGSRTAFIMTGYGVEEILDLL